MTKSTNKAPRRSRFIPRTVLAFLGAVLGGICSSASSTEPPAPITNSRICAALAVYAMGKAPEWDERAARAEQVLDSADARGQVADCGAGVRTALATDFDPLRWQVSLALVDATGDGSDLSPDACPSAAPRQSLAEGQRLFSTGGAR